MTNPNFQTNGASLEDCHTNFFALTDLCGIKWRRFSSDTSTFNPLEDPVLASFSRCLAADVLCVWRKTDSKYSCDSSSSQKLNQHHNYLGLNCSKELWIFWYGEELDLRNLISSELILQEPEQGSWENGLSYECRTLLFKALHNLIERCLFTHGLIRIGRWFVQPYDSADKIETDSTVCIALDVRQHAPVYRLEQSQLLSVQTSQILLAPYGLCGTLTGNTLKENDSQAKKILDEWQKFYPLNPFCYKDANIHPVIEIFLGDVRVLYPSCFVLLTDVDHISNNGDHYDVDSVNTHNLLSKTAFNLFEDGQVTGFNHDYIIRCVWENSCSKNENALNLQDSFQPSTTELCAENSSVDTLGLWNFYDPLIKNKCCCSRTKSGKDIPSVKWNPENSLNYKNHHNKCFLENKHKKSVPFHKQQYNNGDMPAFLDDNAASQFRSKSLVSSFINLSSEDQVHNFKKMSFLNSHLPADSGFMVISPSSTNLSPTATVTSKLVSHLEHNHKDDLPAAFLASNIHEKSSHDEDMKAASDQNPYFYDTRLTSIENKNEMKSPNSSVSLKRPHLPIEAYELIAKSDSQSNNDALYDFLDINIWAYYPIKKLHLLHYQNVYKNNLENTKDKKDTMFRSEWCNFSEVIQELPKTKDPYTFTEDGDNMHPHAEVLKKSVEDSESKKDSTSDQVTANSKTVSLFTSQGLEPSFQDLDNIFETSDDNNSDHELVPTPPGSNKSSGVPEDNLFSSHLTKLSGNSSSVSGSSCSASGMLGIMELTKMFPTPPSLEHNPIPVSPSSQTDQINCDVTDNLGGYCVIPKDIKVEHVSEYTCEKEREIIPVFKLLSSWQLPVSNKYAPLQILSSQQHSGEFSQPPKYYPSIANPVNMMDRSATSHLNSLGAASFSSALIHKPGWSPISPATNYTENPLSHRSGPESVGLIGYDLASPASNNSSYVNRNLNSADSLQLPQAHGLMINIILSDSFLNIFCDHNFESASLCVCSNTCSVRGIDLYVPSFIVHDDEHVHCSCGFNAVSNRHLAYRAGLFAEDEEEITGMLSNCQNVQKSSCQLTIPNVQLSVDAIINSATVDRMPFSILELFRLQSQSLSSNSPHWTKFTNHYLRSKVPIDQTMNLLSFSDMNEVTRFAIEHSRLSSASGSIPPKTNNNHKRTYIHKWPFVNARGPDSTHDIMRTMKMIQPFLQHAIQKQKTKKEWESFKVSGPLTWRQFHRLAGRGTEDQCEPQPIPTLLVGHDKDSLLVSPYAIAHWERLLLEPYSCMRDIAYIVVAPDNEFVLSKLCRLGRHKPITKVLRHGIMRVGKTAAQKLAGEPIDEWFSLLGDSVLASRLRLYAQVCRHHLGPHLATLNLDSSLFKSTVTNKTAEKANNSMPPPLYNDASQQCSNTPKGENDEIIDSARETNNLNAEVIEEEESDVPAIVVYMIDPFTVSGEHSDLCKIIWLGLTKCYQQLLRSLPESQQTNIKLHIIPLENILTLMPQGRTTLHAHLKEIAFSIFTSCRTILTQNCFGKSLTGFGPAANAELFLKNKSENQKMPYAIYTPPFILAPLQEKGVKLEDLKLNICEKESVLHCCYCLSEDQNWLLAACTDSHGEILENVIINIDTLQGNSSNRISMRRRVGLQKLMDFILSVMSIGVVGWRLVLCRLGRIGHGELKGWSGLLSRKNLQHASRQIRESCRQCSYLPAVDTPCILSACLVSLEPDARLRLMSDQFTFDERFGQNTANCSLSTPEDVSSTHILVFPTSATTQSSQATFQQEHINSLNPLTLESDIENDADFLNGLDLNGELGAEGIDGMQEIDDLFNYFTTGPGAVIQSPPDSPKREGGGIGIESVHSSKRDSNTLAVDSMEEAGQLLQQPLALGFYVSTAATGIMPKWFWSACPHLEHVSPTFLKSALHLHSPSVQQQQDDLLQHNQQNSRTHPLDSQYTTDVLRHVLEGYNSLSWLVLDHRRSERKSCLPIHMQLLLQTYHTMAPLV